MTEGPFIRCDFTLDGTCAARVPEACICAGYAYQLRKLRAREEQEAARRQSRGENDDRDNKRSDTDD